MTFNRRHFIATAAATGSVTFLPFAARAAAHSADTFATNDGEITVHPVSHASFVMETPAGTIYCDPVGGGDRYKDLPRPDLILITHEHGDHYDPETLSALVGDATRLITNVAVFEMLPEKMRAQADSVVNGGALFFNDLRIEAVAAYNTTPDRLKYHPHGRDNGYVLDFDGLRVYISGDTEDTPEMRALRDIGLAFVCMNLPFTMDSSAAASAVSEFKPKFVYPYHYRGRDGGTQDPKAFAGEVGDGIEVKFADWYD